MVKILSRTSTALEEMLQVCQTFTKQGNNTAVIMNRLWYNNMFGGNPLETGMGLKRFFFFCSQTRLLQSVTNKRTLKCFNDK
jgi:hypothetical protein